MTKTDKESLSRRLKELKNVDIIRRVRKNIKKDEQHTYTFKDPRSTYIINPELIRPMDHDEAEFLWEQCGG